MQLWQGGEKEGENPKAKAPNTKEAPSLNLKAPKGEPPYPICDSLFHWSLEL
jgi:hypothetical protein